MYIVFMRAYGDGRRDECAVLRQRLTFGGESGKATSRAAAPGRVHLRINRMKENTTMTTETVERIVSGAPPASSVMIRVDGVTRVIATKAIRTTILDGISFVVPQGSLFSIAGPSGSGKSTLVNILTGIDQPTEGQVIFGGNEIRTMRENALATRRGKNLRVIFQFSELC